MPLPLFTPKVCQERVMKRLKMYSLRGWGDCFFNGSQLVYFKGPTNFHGSYYTKLRNFGGSCASARSYT